MEKFIQKDLGEIFALKVFFFRLMGDTIGISICEII